MWIFTTRGFFSAVEHRNDHDLLMVRARSRADLESLVDLASLVLPDWVDSDIEIVETLTQADYPFRVVIAKDDWAALLGELTDEIEYDNFKNAVDAAGNRLRAHTYGLVWETLHDIEHEPTSGVTGTAGTPTRRFHTYVGGDWDVES